MAIAVGGRQRGLRQRPREILDPVVKACDEYQRAVPDYLTEEFLRTTAEKLRILSKRDGLKSPNANHIGQLLDILVDIANRFHVARLLPGHGISQQERERLLEANEQRFNIAVEQAKRRAATYIRAVNKMDSWHYLESQDPVGDAQGFPQSGHLRGQDRQRTRLQMTGDPQIQLGLPGSQPLGRSGLQRRQLNVIVGRTEMLD